MSEQEKREYYVRIEVEHEHEWLVEATSPEEARRVAERLWDEGNTGENNGVNARVPYFYAADVEEV